MDLNDTKEFLEDLGVRFSDWHKIPEKQKADAKIIYLKEVGAERLADCEWIDFPKLNNIFMKSYENKYLSGMDVLDVIDKPLDRYLMNKFEEYKPYDGEERC